MRKLEEKLQKVREFSDTLEAMPSLDAWNPDYKYDLGFAEGHNAALAALKKVLDS